MENTRRKYVYLVAMLLAFATGSAVAQQQQGGNGPGNSLGNGPGNGPGIGPGNSQQASVGPSLRLVEELALDEYQIGEITAIFEESRALHEEERIRAFENQDAIRQETHLAIMSVLNEDQQARFEELVQIRKERWAGEDSPFERQRGPRPDRPGGNCSGDECPLPVCPNEDCPNDGNGPGPGGG